MFNVDNWNADYVAGWITGSQRAIFLKINGVDAGAVPIGFPRTDVGESRHGEANASLSGFRAVFQPGQIRPGPNQIELSARYDGQTVDWNGEVLGPAVRNVLADVKTPFPPELTPVLSERMGRAIESSYWTAGLEDQAVDVLILAAQRGSRWDADLWRYLSFLSRMWLQFAVVHRQFPVHNRFSRFLNDTEFGPYNPVDVLCIQTHPLAEIVIAAQLYNLKQRGIVGRVFEFGCFKGFSTCCLSLACKDLGLQLVTFDSFQGLPKIEEHAPHSYKGAFEEVDGNVRAFGARDVVTFQKGYFSESLKGFPAETPMAIFVDVDFEVSAADMSRAVTWLNPAGAIFCDETYPKNFDAEGRVSAQRGPESVLPPLLDALASISFDPRGRYLYGNLSAIWQAGIGSPVLSSRAIYRLLKACLPNDMDRLLVLED